MATDKKPLMAYLRVQEAHERELLIILKRGVASIDAELAALEGRAGVGAMVRRDQLRQSQAAIRRRIAVLWELVGSQVQADRARAAAAAADTMFDYDAVLFRAVPRADVDLLRRSAVATAQRGLDTLESRVLGLSRVPLSSRVYKSGKVASGAVDRLIESALARGASPAELARDVRKYINPNTPGGLRYAAQRLGRTELNNAFHATSIRQSLDKPWVTGMRWNLSGSHKVPDECNIYAEIGVYEVKAVPPKPHPQCLCYVTPETKPRRDFVNDFNAGAYDSAIDSLITRGSVSL